MLNGFFDTFCDGYFKLVQQGYLMSIGSGAFFMGLFLLPSVLQSRNMRYQFIYPVYTLVLLYSSIWVYDNILEVVMSYAPARFVGLIPVPFVIALMISRGCYSLKGSMRIFGVLAALLLIFYISDDSEDFYDNLYQAENVYGLPQDVVDVCDLILSEVEEPLILVNDPDAQYFRQYSADIKLVNVNIASMSNIAATRSEYSQIRQLMANSDSIDIEDVGELAAACGVNYIIVNVGAYDYMYYADLTWYRLYDVVGEYMVFKVNS